MMRRVWDTLFGRLPDLTPPPVDPRSREDQRREIDDLSREVERLRERVMLREREKQRV